MEKSKKYNIHAAICPDCKGNGFIKAAIEEGRETRTRTWKEIMELVRCDVREMVDTGDAVFDEWAKRTIGGFE